jgi:hypothetical protein
MKSKLLIPAAALLMGVSTGAWAADDDGAEATIRLMGTAEAELPDAVTKKISLPDHLLVEGEDQVAAVEKAKNGHDRVNARRENKTTGQERAEEVRQQGKEMAENAKEVRENRGRSEDPPGRPDDPGRPGDPGRP